jgi:5-formyltetrahydrofolate cyclo-ligase
MNDPRQPLIEPNVSSAQAFDADLSARRKEWRTKLLRDRTTMPTQEHQSKSGCVLQSLFSNFKHLSAGTVGFYWPFRGEISVLPFIELLVQQGGAAALPVVIEKKQPLEFRAWTPSTVMSRGVYGIPHPAEGRPIQPDTLIIPLVGYDLACYRLGYGGGFYDRTLSAADKKILAIGVGFESARIGTIQPQPYDVPMDFIINESSILERATYDRPRCGDAKQY